MHGDTEIGLEENCKSSSMQDELKTDYKKLLFILELHMSSTRFRWKTQAMKAYKQGTTLWYMRQSCCLWAQQPIWAATHVSDTPLSTQFPGHENSGGWPKSSGLFLLPGSPGGRSWLLILAWLSLGSWVQLRREPADGRTLCHSLSLCNLDFQRNKQVFWST